MKQAVFIIFTLLLVFCTNLEAQKKNADCPFTDVSISIDENKYEKLQSSGLVDLVCPHTVVTFIANVKNLDSKIKPTFKWRISKGEILSGQGTSSIEVQTQSEPIMAIVELVDLPKTFSSCPMRSSKTVYVACCFPCTTASIKAPDSISSSDRVFTADASISDPTLTGISYDWTITDGIILEGQGTKTIRAKCLGLESCIVGFDIKGMAPECPSQVSKTIEVEVWEYFTPRKIDSYGDLSFEIEKKHLELLGLELYKATKAQGYIIVYYRPEEITDEIINRVKQVKQFLATNFGIYLDRVTVIYEGNRGTQMTELWIAPKGVKPPIQPK